MPDLEYGQEGWLAKCRACNSTSFVGGQGQPLFCPKCGNSLAEPDRQCGATNLFIDGGKPCTRTAGHLTNPLRMYSERHITDNGFWWSESGTDE